MRAIKFLLPPPCPARHPAGISPEMGPVFGDTEVYLHGLRFHDGKVSVKFGNSEKTDVAVDAEFVDATTIRCRTPNYEAFGAMPVDVSVSINGDGWTVNRVRYSFFANTAARNCLVFGPGVLERGGLFGVEMPFIIQARDTNNEKRTSGGDTFTVRITSADGKAEGVARVEENYDGTYLCAYAAPIPGRHLVHIMLAELGSSEPVPVRGSPFPVELGDPWVHHRVMGAVPAKRKGASLVALGSELVLYGGDRSGVSVCATGSADWKWTLPAVGGTVPADRSAHNAVVTREDAMVVFGGTALTDGGDLNDLCWLRRQQGGAGWAWGCPNVATPYIR